MKVHALKLTSAISLAILIIASPHRKAVAQAILDNTANGSSGYAAVEYDNDPFMGLSLAYAAQAFTTGADATSLTSLLVDIAQTSGSGFQMALYSDNSGSPGSQIASLNGSSSPATGIQTYTAASPVSLAAATTYWWVATASSESQYGIAINSNPNFITTDGWSINDDYAYGDGTSWTATSTSGYRLLFSVDATVTAAPEPSFLALAAFGLGAGAIFLRRQTR